MRYFGQISCCKISCCQLHCFSNKSVTSIQSPQPSVCSQCSTWESDRAVALFHFTIQSGTVLMFAAFCLGINECSERCLRPPPKVIFSRRGSCSRGRQLWACSSKYCNSELLSYVISVKQLATSCIVAVSISDTLVSIFCANVSANICLVRSREDHAHILQGKSLPEFLFVSRASNLE